MTYLKKLVLLLIITEIFLSAFIIYEDYSGTYKCITGDCKEVQNSEYGQIFGIKVSVIGLTSFVALLGLWLLSHKNTKMQKLFLTATAIGALGAIYFISVQLFILKKICSNCIAIDITIIIIAILSLYEFSKNNKLK